jgi:hypothetical protein
VATRERQRVNRSAMHMTPPAYDQISQAFTGDAQMSRAVAALDRSGCRHDAVWRITLLSFVSS